MFAFLAFFKTIPLKVWILIGAVLVSLFAVWYVIHGYTSQIKDLTDANKTLTAENVQLQLDVKTAVDANTTNMETITQLRNDKKAAEDAKLQMAIQSKRDKQAMQDIRNVINISTDNTVAAPVLKQTVDSIVQNRKAKEMVK